MMLTIINITKRYLSILSFFFIMSSSLGGTIPSPFCLITIPKSGSHLFIKTLFLLTGFTPIWHVDPVELQPYYKQHQYPYTHLILSDILLNTYVNNSEIKTIIVVRDLRDVCVSIVFQILKEYWPGLSQSDLHIFKSLSFDEQLYFVIDQEYYFSTESDSNTRDLQVGFSKIAEQFSQLIRNKPVLLCRFENIIGIQGEGSDQKQYQEIKKIADFLNVSTDQISIREIQKKLFGNIYNPFGSNNFIQYESSYRKGKIGSWKNYFTESHKWLFKEKVGHFLIELGYENDFDW